MQRKDVASTQPDVEMLGILDIPDCGCASFDLVDQAPARVDVSSATYSLEISTDSLIRGSSLRLTR